MFMSQSRHKPFPVPRKPYEIILLTSQLSERRIALTLGGQMPKLFQQTLNTALAAQGVFYHEGLATFQS